MNIQKIFSIVQILMLGSVGGLFAQSPSLNVDGGNGVSVNLQTGNLFYQRTDLYIRGQGLPLDFTFSYNSASGSVNHGCGYGWTFSYNIHYTEDTAGNFLLTRSAGRQDTFLLNGGSYGPPMGNYDTVENYDGDKFKLTTRYGLKYFFEDSSHKKLTKIEDLFGNSLTLNYTGPLLSQIMHSSGRSVEMTWADGFLTQITDSNDLPARIFMYAYVDGNLKEVTDPLGNRESYRYDNSRNLTEITDKNGAPMSIEYNTAQKVKKFTSCLGTQKFTYAAFKTYRVEKGSTNDRVTTYGFNEPGLLISATRANHSLLYEYDANGNVAKFIDYNGNSTTYSYDANGNVLTQTDAIGHTQNYTYNTYNRVTSETDKNGHSTVYTYNPTNNLTSIQYPDGTTQSMAYDAFGNMVSVTNEAGNTFTLGYDGHGNLTDITYPIGAETLGYDGRGNVVSITNPQGKTTNITYNALYNVVAVTDALSNTITYTYDAVGNAISETYPNSVVKTFAYDALNRLISVGTNGQTTSYEYGDFGKLKSIADANGNKTSFEYDNRGLLSSESDALDNTIHYTYDGNYNLLSEKNANGDITAYTYDAFNRVKSRACQENTDIFTYDNVGNMLTASNDDISISYTYGSRNRLLSKTIDNWGKAISYTYDNVGNRTSMTDPEGNITNYSYNLNNRLTSLTNQLGATTFSMDIMGRLIQQNNPNGTYSTYTYDDAGQWIGVSHFDAMANAISGYTYTYDNHGNRLTTTDDNAMVRQHFYDDLNRLDSVIYGNGDTGAYGFDDVGNRVLFRENGLPTSYSYNEGNQIENAGAISYFFDKNGNMEGKTEGGDTTFYQYDPKNRLTGITYPSGATSSFKYDPFGSRISVTDTTGKQSRFFYDFRNILLEIDQMGSTEARYSSGLSPDSWLSMEQNGASYFYHRDGLGSITQLSDAGGAVAQSYEYDAFGNITQQVGSIENPFVFTGREKDFESGLQYHRTRYYDPSMGRFITKDNFFGFQRKPSSLHKYLYTENNPSSYVDNNGQFAFIPLLWYAGAALLGAAAGTAAGTYVNSQSDFHTKRNWLNRTPSSSPPGKEWGEPLEDDLNVYHQPPDWDLDVYPYPNKKYLLPDGNGGSFEAILQPDGSYLTTGTQQGTYNYFHPDGIFSASSAGHVLWDVAPHYFNDNYEDCDEDDEDGNNDPNNNNENGDPFNIPRLHAVDPNEIDGSTGHDSLQWVSVNDRLGYTVYYENDPDFATAPAQIVRIDLPVDSNLNIFSVRLGNFGFGQFNYDVPPNTTFYQQRLTDTEDSLNVHVDVTAGIDVVGGKVFWIFESIDPTTGLPPEDALTGFLPVNDTSINIYNDTLTKKGEGFVTFNIVPQGSLETGDSVTAQASIVFDINDPIETNTWKNFIDAFPPTSSMDTLPQLVPSSTVELQFNGMDDPGGVGLSYYDLYVSKDGGPFLLHTSGIDTTSFLFNGSSGHYAFYTRATDHVGNTEADKMVADEEVVLGDECATLLVINMANLINGIYRSEGLLTSFATTIASGSIVNFKSDTAVHLDYDFSVDLGAQFEVIIEACPSN